MVLLTLVIVLCWKVYDVAFPSEEKPPTWEGPGAVQQLDWTGPPPDSAPPFPSRPSIDKLIRMNPFTVQSLERSERGQSTQADLELRVIRIRDVGGTLKAEISTAGRRSLWYGEGQSFETYRIVSVDRGANTVEIYSEEHARTYTLTAEKN